MVNKKKLAVFAAVGAAGYRTEKYVKKKKEAKESEKTEEQITPHRQGFYEKYIKRPQDFCCALLAIIVLSPVMLVTAIMVRVKLGSPMLFTQERPGLNGKIFKLYKFRTMTDERDDNGELLPDEMRLTKFGKTLRSTSLDELPELWNILCGDMAVVGPRPLLVRYLSYYTEEEMTRHSVRPGLTGYAQAHGRNAVNWDDKLEMDVWYANHISFLTDLSILLTTVKIVLKREDVQEEGAEALDVYRNRKTKNV